MMIRAASLALVLACAGAAASEAQAPPATAAPAPSLYQRLGGYDAIAAVVDDFVPRLATDAQLGHFFAAHSVDSKMRIRQLALDFFCARTGGPCVYIGRDLKLAHKGLGITDSDWQVAIRHLEATLDKLKVAAREKGEFLALVASFKGEIVEKT